MSQLSDMVGNYEKLRYNDQQAIQKLKDRVTQLDIENTALAKVASPEPDSSTMSVDDITDKLKALKSSLREACEVRAPSMDYHGKKELPSAYCCIIPSPPLSLLPPSLPLPPFAPLLNTAASFPPHPSFLSLPPPSLSLSPFPSYSLALFCSPTLPFPSIYLLLPSSPSLFPSPFLSISPFLQSFPYFLSF